MDKKTSIVKRIICVCLFTVLLFLAVFGVYNVLRWKDTTGDYLSSVEQLKNTPKNSIDVVFVGSSHVYCDIYPCFLWEKYGIASFNMSVSGQDKDSSYYHLKNLLKTQNPKVIFVDMFGLTYDKHAIEGNVYRNLLAFNTSKNSVDLVNDYFEGDEDVNKGDFYFRWPIIHTRYRELQRYDFAEYLPNRYLRGEGLSFESNPTDSAPAAYDTFAPCELSEKNRKWLERLYDLSQKEGFSLVFMSLPFYSDYLKQPLIDAAAQFARSHDCGFIDFNRIYEEVGLDYGTDFFDSGHTNAYGSRKISEYLGDYLKEKYDLTDYRGDSRFWQWDKDLEFYYRAEFVDSLDKAGNVSEFCKTFLDKTENYTLVVSLEYIDILDNASEDFYESLSKFGMNYDEYAVGGKWIYKEGVLTKVHENDNSPVYIYELSSHDTLSIKYSGDGKTENIMVNTEDYSNVGAYMDFIVYDNLTEEIVLRKRY